MLGYRGSEVAELLDSSEDSVKGALKRARAAMESALPSGREQAPLPGSPQERELVAAFADAWEADDVDRMVSLLTEDAWLTMPPSAAGVPGSRGDLHLLRGDRRRASGRAVRLVPTRANTQPAFLSYLADPHGAVSHATVLIVLTLEGERISALTGFSDTGIFARFGLPRTLPSD